MKVFLAGTSVFSRYKDELYNIDYILESFYAVEEWQMPVIKNAKMFLLDSGAFTYMNSLKDSKINWDDYIERYAEFINKNNIDYFFELDIDSLVGLSEVERLRHKLETLTHKPAIPVWHKSRGIDYYKGMCRDYNYISIGGIVIHEIKKPDYGNFIPMLKYAKEHNCNVHGLGFTPTKELKKYPFFSVDSTNWLSGGRFGTLQMFNGNYIECRSFKTQNKKAIWKDINIHNLREWIKFQKYADIYL